MRSDDHPGSSTTTGTQIFGDGLELQHHLGVVTDKLADFIDQEHDALVATTIQILAHPFAEIGNVEGKHRLQIFHALQRRGLGLPGGIGPGLSHFIAAETIGIAFILPGRPLELGKLLLKGLVLTTGIQFALQMGDMRVIGAVAESLVEHAQEDFEDRIFFVFGIGSTVDVEEDHLRAAINRRVDIAEEQAVIQLVTEKIDGSARLTI